MKLKREGTPKQDINMKKLFRRNQIIITTLAIMIAAAGYLNYAGKRDLAASTGEDIYQAGTFDISEEDLLAENQKKGQEDTAMIEEAQPQAEGTKLQAEASQDGSFLAEADAGTDQAVIDSWDGGEEAGMENPGEAVLTSGLTVSDYIAGVQLNREQIRARNKETLNSIINSTNIDEAAKQEDGGGRKGECCGDAFAGPGLCRSGGEPDGRQGRRCDPCTFHHGPAARTDRGYCKAENRSRG